MTYNLLTYFIYLPVTIIITIYIGWLFYKHGEVFLLGLFNNNKALVQRINNILLLGYYLTNIGYAILSISNWETLISLHQMLTSLSRSLGTIILGLALLHFNNVYWLHFIHKKQLLNH